jgi:G3E family GTPase
MDTPGPIELLLITGPLGAGKTTVVNRLLRGEIEHGRRVAVLINEFGNVSVDGALVGTARPEVAGIENLVNGCVCCSLRSDVVQALRGWTDRDAGQRPQRIVLETTGLADPTDLLDLELEPLLAGRIRLSGCLTVVSALAPLQHLAERTLLRHQAALASLIYVSKSDLDPSMAVAWESQLRAAHPGIPVVRSRHGESPPGSPDPWAGEASGRAHAGEAGVGFASARALAMSFDHPLDPDALESLFLAPPAGGELLRAKGICTFAGWPQRNDGSDRWSFQWADGRLEVGPLPQPPGTSPTACVVVIIGVGLSAADWKSALRGLERPPQGARRKRNLQRGS